MNWNRLYTQNDIDEFLEIFGWFHDSCIKEIKYISGTYATENLAMHPVNSMRDLKVIFHRMFENPSSIEMHFEKLICLKLTPCDENYLCDIFDSFFKKVDDVFYWADTDYFDPNEPYKIEQATWISCKGVKWRVAEEYLGEQEIYINSK